MSDHQGKGPPTNEGRVEKNTSRPAENSTVTQLQQQTKDQIRKTTGK